MDCSSVSLLHSSGFMCGDIVLDKDGVSAYGVVAEMTNQVYTKGCGSLSAKLDEIYTTYGYHTTNNSYYFCYAKKNIEDVHGTHTRV